jgi:hypothetical protein
MDDVKLSFDLAVAAPGGGLTAFLLWPQGCTTDTLFDKDPLCLDGERTNVFGWTMFGLVGDANSNGAFVLGLFVAVLIFCALALYQVVTAEDSSAPPP